ncbi:transmembrane protein 165-like isoform X1 [Varroa jacobsoni]|uniref:transmembrane protein 165-like isoform X1 n=1 Tax=Varroa jacobsoni TaxID=62625 RepID=UPI000BF3F806|nr:transmembrane protein 165-like isoform X1 [Varroa jacobsoni]
MTMVFIILAIFSVAAFLSFSASEEVKLRDSFNKEPHNKHASRASLGELKAHSDTLFNGTTASKIKLQENPYFWQGFISALSVIVVSEIGDKTFFIAAIMAMHHQAAVVFAGAISALFIMTALSAMMGSLTHLIPREYTHYASIVLLIFFGVKMTYEACQMSDNEVKEGFQEVQQELNEREMGTSANVGNGRASSKQTHLYIILSRIFWQALVLTFVAEWGDRSQLATIILVARENVWAVNMGAIFGHLLCTCLAVVAGSFVAKRVSIKTLTYIGGFVFLGFALWAFFTGIANEE